MLRERDNYNDFQRGWKIKPRSFLFFQPLDLHRLMVDESLGVIKLLEREELEMVFHRTGSQKNFKKTKYVEKSNSIHKFGFLSHGFESE